MVPSRTHPAWARLIRGQIDHQFGLAACGLLIFNLRREHQADPSRLDEQVDRARTFFEKYEALLRRDIVQIFAAREVHADHR